MSLDVRLGFGIIPSGSYIFQNWSQDFVKGLVCASALLEHLSQRDWGNFVRFPTGFAVPLTGAQFSATLLKVILIFQFKLFFISFHMHWHFCLCVFSVLLCASRGQQISRTGTTNVCEQSCGFQKSNPGPLEAPDPFAQTRLSLYFSVSI